jgi:RNA polymerase sigma-70 factor (ECF subfamily)
VPGAPVRLPTEAGHDAALFEQILRGSPAAFAALFDRHASVVRRALARSLGESDEVEDLVQEVFLIVSRRISTLRDPTALRSFVYSVAVRVARNELRKRRFRRLLVPWVRASVSARSVPPHDSAAAQAVRRVQELLEKLTPDEHIAFVLRRVEQLPLAEAAGAAACSLATFKRRLARAERRFGELAGADPVLQAWLSQGGEAS